MAQVEDGIYVGRQAPKPAPELFWIWHDKTNQTEVWIYDVRGSGYKWPSASNTHATLDITFAQLTPPSPGNQAAFETWVQARSGLPASDLLVQVMTY